MSVTAPQGFLASGLACGIKASGAPDLALVAASAGAVPAAGVFTANLAAAAPVQVSRAHLVASAGRAAAVVLSSGNANAATGAPGVGAAERMCALVGEGLGVDATEVLVCQTGLIGIPFPLDPVQTGIPLLVEARRADRDGSPACRHRHHDHRHHLQRGGGRGGRVHGGSHGQGRGHARPQHGDDVGRAHDGRRVVTPAPSPARCARAVEGTFNRMTVDGCTSTNDTVVVLANGESGTTVSADLLTDALGQACGDLAGMMAADAEGATKVAHVVVTGAASDDEAHRAARKVAQSPLVKCSLNGADPYWGRVVSELGSAGVAFDLDRVELSYGGVAVCRAGVAVEHDAKAVRHHMEGRAVELRCDLGLGSGTGAVLFTDLGHGYIDENRTTS